MGATDRFLKRGRIQDFSRSPIAKMLSELRKFGANGHLYIPGVGAISGITAGNYLDSIGTTQASVDGNVGLVKDALGGLNASQATTGYQPILRRGIVNLLRYSNDLSNAAWSKSGGVPATAVSDGYQLVGVSGVYRFVYQNKTHAAGVQKTFVVRARSTTPGTTNPFRLAYGVSGGVFSPVMRTTDAFAYYCVSFTSVATDVLAFASDATNTAFDVVIEGMGVFDGVLSAQQVAAAGGIPLTTTAAVSSSAGAYKWEFDGTDDLISLGAVPFQMADDHFVSVAARVDSFASNAPLFSLGNSGINNSRIQLYTYATTGQITGMWRDDSGTAVVTSAGTPQVGAMFVASLRKVGESKLVRMNGVAGAALGTSVGTTTFDKSRVGESAGAFSKGQFGGLLAIKGTVTDSQALIFERGLNALSQYAAGRF